MTGDVTRDTARTVNKIGPVTKWSVQYFGSEAAVLLHTETAVYTCSKAAAKYRASFADLVEQAEICFEIVQVWNLLA